MPPVDINICPPSISGMVLAANGSVAAPGIAFANFPSSGLSTVGGNVYVSALGVQVATFTTDGIATSLPLTIVINELGHRGIHILRLKGKNDATLPCRFELANTWTSDTNSEMGVIDWQATANVCTFGTTKAGAGTLREARFAADASIAVRVNGTGTAFFGTAPIAKPTVTGAKAANAALTSLCTQLAALGLITDSTT